MHTKMQGHSAHQVLSTLQTKMLENGCQ